jgi:hypothetical protein
MLPSFGIDRAAFLALNQKARDAARRQDWSAMRSSLLELGQQMPGPTPAYMLRMASVEARLGNDDSALEWLSRYAATGLKYDLAKDDTFKALANRPKYRQIESAMHDRALPISNAQMICSLPILDLMPEDIAYDESARVFFVSSVRHHSVYRVRPPDKGSGNCAVEQLLSADFPRHWPVLAVSLDAKRNLLWATEAALEGFSDIPQGDAGKTALLAVDKQSGKILRRFELVAHGPAEFGDMCLAADGTVYVSDGAGGGVYRVRGDPRTASLEKVADGLFSPQTPALAADGKRLFVADYSMGIAVVGLHSPSRTPEYLPHPDDVAVTGLDGLYRSGDSLIGMQNGTEPERIIRFRLNRQQTRIVSAEVIEQSTARLGDPTHAVLVGPRFYVSANVGWDKVDDNGQLKNGRHFTAPALLSFPADE